MNASEARNIAENHEPFHLELWWREIKDEVFKAIKEEALKGEYSLVIGLEDKINIGGWILNKKYTNYVEAELKVLGYKVDIRTDITVSLQISWR